MNEDQYLQPRAEVTAGDVARALWRNRWIVLALTALCLAGGFYATRLMTRKWRADAQVVLLQRPVTGKASDDPSYVAPISETIDTQIGMMLTSTEAERALDWMKNQDMITGQTPSGPLLTPGDVQSDLTIINPKNTDLINVTVQAPDRRQALRLANAVIFSFAQWKTEMARKDIQQTTVNLRRQVKIAHTRMNAALNKQLAYKQGNHLVDAATQEHAAIETLMARETDLNAVQQDLLSNQARVSALAAQVNAANRSLRGVGGPRNDALVQSIQAQLAQAEMDRDALARVVTPAYPGKLPQLQAQVKDLQQRLNKALGSTLSGGAPSLQSQAAVLQDYQQAQVALAFSQAKVASARQQAAGARQVVDAMPRMDAGVTQLGREADIAFAHYTTLQSALDAAGLAESRISGNVQITQPASAASLPFRPNLFLNVGVGGLIGLALSLALVLILEQTDRRLRRDEQVKALGVGPALGMLPRVGRQALARSRAGALPAPVAEAFSIVRTNLMQVLGNGRQGEGTLLLITSAHTGEGKSLTAAELARSLARSGRRVILVDANLRHPTQGTLFADAPAEGLAEVLAGQVSLDDALTSSETPNLSLLFSGVARANPSDFLPSEEMADLLRGLRGRADHVIVDAPACSVPDPLLLAPLCDYVMLVVGLGRADEDAVRAAAAALKAAAPVGLFINRTTFKRARAFELVRPFEDPQLPYRRVPPSPRRRIGTERTLLMYRSSMPGLPETSDTEEAPEDGHQAAEADPRPIQLKSKEKN